MLPPISAVPSGPRPRRATGATWAEKWGERRAEKWRREWAWGKGSREVPRPQVAHEDRNLRLPELPREGREQGAEAGCFAEFVQHVVDEKLAHRPDGGDHAGAHRVEDLVLAAVRDALRKGQERMAEEMARVTDGLGLPPLGL